jgi:His-Xaa-Ser system protein HxsD
MKAKKKTPKKSVKKAAKPAKAVKARKAVPPPTPKISAAEATFSLDVKAHGLEPVLGAAYLLTDRAYVSLGGDRAKVLTVTLRPKNAKALKPRALADEFLSDLASQKVRWAVSKNNQPVREYVAEQAVLIATGQIKPAAPAAAAPEPAVDELTDAQRLEIEKLIAEVESEIKTMNADKAKPSVADPKNVAASWEAAQEKKPA